MKRIGRKTEFTYYACSPKSVNFPEKDKSLTEYYKDVITIKTCLEKEVESQTKLETPKRETNTETFGNYIKEIVGNLCSAHPQIATDPQILNGIPHIKGVRLTVGNVLEKIYIYGSIDKIREIYGEDISENQIKEAIAFAQDFLEDIYASAKS